MACLSDVKAPVNGSLGGLRDSLIRLVRVNIFAKKRRDCRLRFPGSPNNQSNTSSIKLESAHLYSNAPAARHYSLHQVAVGRNMLPPYRATHTRSPSLHLWNASKFLLGKGANPQTDEGKRFFKRLVDIVCGYVALAVRDLATSCAPHRKTFA
jgi:hypothetical protein